MSEPITADALLNDAICSMERLLESLSPDERAEDATVPAAAVRKFVDDHARLLNLRSHMKDDERSDTFYLGSDAHKHGKSESDCPGHLNEELKLSWLTGFRSAERYARTPRLSREESDRVFDEADRAYVECKVAGTSPVNPYPADTEASAIWNCRMCDLPLIHGDIEDDFEVLGTPTVVTVVARHPDGSTTLSMPAPVQPRK